MLVLAGCHDAEDRRAPAPPPAAVEPVIAPCPLDPVPASARVASRDREGPWLFGQAVFEYVSQSPPHGTRHVNHNDVGGSSSVGWTGKALTFELPPNSSLPSGSLLVHGPPPTLAYRAPAAGRYRVSLALCPTTRSAPQLDLDVLRRDRGADPVATAPVAELMYGGAAARPIVETLWSTRPPKARLAQQRDVDLGAGDVIRLVAIGVPDASGTLEIAFDVAVWPLSEPR